MILHIVSLKLGNVTTEGKMIDETYLDGSFGRFAKIKKNDGQTTQW